MREVNASIKPVHMGAEIVRRIARGRRRISLVCPYVTSEEILEAIRQCSAPTKQLLTRYNPSDILAGATDLGIIKALAEAHVEIHVFKDVHAKVYVIDDWAYVGSANLTDSGLGGLLREFGRGSDDATHASEALQYFDSIWDQAAPISLSELDLAQEGLKTMGAEARAVDHVRQQAEESLAFAWRVPDTPGEDRRQCNALAVDTRGKFIEHKHEHSVLMTDGPQSSLRAILVKSGCENGAKAAARVIARAIRAVQNFEHSEHWTLNQPEDAVLRLSVGRAEVLTIDRPGTLAAVALLGLLPERARQEIVSAGGEIARTPYATVQQVVGEDEGLRISLPLNKVARFEQVLCENLKAYLSRDTSDARSLHRRWLSTDAVRTIAQLAQDPQLEVLAEELGAKQ